MDGAKSLDVLRSQILALPRGGWSLVTLTVGGNDALEAVRQAASRANAIIGRFSRNLDLILSRLFSAPSMRVILATIYDPTDGTGVLLGRSFDRSILDRMNDLIRERASDAARAGRPVAVADLHAHFLGHGAGSMRWYQTGIEPSARGSHEVRACFWNSLAGFAGR